MEKRNASLSWLLFLILIIVSIIGSLYWYSNRDKGFVDYKNTQVNISIKYPKTWTYDENKNGAVVIFYSPAENELDFFKENINLVVHDISGTRIDLVSYTESAIEQMQNLFQNNMDIIDTNSKRLAGEFGYEIEFLGKGPQGDVKYYSIWTIKDKIVYQLTYLALASKYDLYIDEIKKMVSSFKIHAP